MHDVASNLLSVGDELERLGRFKEAWAKLAEAGELRQPLRLPRWEGPGSSGSVLLVRRRIRHLGAELRNARFAAIAADYIPQVIVATEQRLIPLLSRSFPNVKYVDRMDEVPIADCETSYERLAQHFGASEEEIAASFRPLVAATQGEPSGIGIAWHSTNKRKNLPSVAQWAAFIQPMREPVQSLQYDEIEAGIEQLETLSSRHVVRSPSDQKVDVDGFATSVSLVGGVITISNTTAHMAGALGISCVVILDDLDHLSWPASRDRTPFYPTVRLVRRRGRDWPIVLAEAEALLQFSRTSNMMISNEYLRLNKDLHEAGSYGRRGDKWAARVRDLISEIQPESILDYGCGQGALGRALGSSIREYDPAIEGKDTPPEPADLVVCTDVLEHIEPEYLDAVLDDLRRVTKLCLFAVISTRPAKKILADGRNAHLIVEPWPFWEERLRTRFCIEAYVTHQKEIEVTLRPL